MDFGIRKDTRLDLHDVITIAGVKHKDSQDSCELLVEAEGINEQALAAPATARVLDDESLVSILEETCDGSGTREASHVETQRSVTEFASEHRLRSAVDLGCTRWIEMAEAEGLGDGNPKGAG